MQPAFKKLCSVSACRNYIGRVYIPQHRTPVAKAIKVVCTGLRNSQLAP